MEGLENTTPGGRIMSLISTVVYWAILLAIIFVLVQTVRQILAGRKKKRSVNSRQRVLMPSTQLSCAADIIKEVS